MISISITAAAYAPGVVADTQGVEMPDGLDKFVEEEISRLGATRKTVRQALERQAKNWERFARSKRLSQDDKQEPWKLVERVGRILHFLHAGDLGDNATDDDLALLMRILALPP
jgi:hypothetical protein